MPTSEYLDCEIYLTGYDQAKLSVAGQASSGRPALGEQALLTRVLGPNGQYIQTGPADD